jgi:hypothetical protein
MPMGSKSHNLFNSSKQNSANSGSSEGDEDEQEESEPKSRKRRRVTSPSESDDAEPTITVVPRKRQRLVVEVKAESSDEELRFKPHNKRREKGRTPEKLQVRKASRSTRRRGAKRSPTPDEGDNVDDDEEVEEEELHTPARSLRRRITRRRRSPSVEEEEQNPPRSRRRMLARRRSPSDEEEETQSTPERNIRGARGESDEEDLDDLDDGANDDSNDEEQEELKEEVAYLQSSPLLDRGKLRSMHDKPRNKRQEALEALKRRRAGNNEPSSSATPGRKRAVVVDTDSDSELEIIKEEPDSDVEISEQDDIEDDEVESDREANALDMFQEDHEDENFIDDDADNILGEPSANEDLDAMRLALTLARAKTKELFPYAVEWMVMKKIHPAFDSTKNEYVLTFRKLDDEVKGLAGSKYTSAAWTPDFTRALRARPEIAVNEIGFVERDVMSTGCAACNRTKHPASFEMFLVGQPYDPESLEPLSADSDSDSDSSSGLSEDSETGEKPARNFQRERILPESHRFPLGSTCKANAQVAHTLYHWRYHLYQWVKTYLAAEGHLTAEKLVRRDGWSDRKRHKAARKIIEVMEETGHIRNLYHSYKDQVKAALEEDNEYGNGWGRDGRDGGGGRSGFLLG